MENPTSLEKEWIRSLGSGDTGKMLSAIYEIRNSGSVTILPFLFELIHGKTPYEVRIEILRLLEDIKSQKAVPMIVESIENHDFGEFLPAFVAGCWQSGLDFSSHMMVFARLFVHSDYMTSLEAFTVLEESYPNAGEGERNECLRYLRESEYLVSDEKLPLFRELRSVIESL